ncbi:MAG TPA: STAS domain-containing protein [Bacillota bacterium]|jgi:anti-anti-sigma factor|nr:STAS domain-containing protein [Peptococcaceae bacterium MAG4]NLW37568.1 STAS domain-containing protein [Peptococcaceae bacterium]HPZ42603.1 STAS domain-containing protein [Bacillota bacterium]HUM58523.1 STAS domain-containing protein [Bacillota bacterium]
MNIEATRTGKLLTLALEGRVDAFAAKNLQETVNQKLTPDLDALIFDLKGVSYISSAGLRIILSVVKKMKKNDGSVILCRVGRFCRDVMDTAGFLSLLPVFDTLEEAVAFGLQCIQEKEYLQNWDQMENILLSCGKAKVIPGSPEKSEALVTGDIKDVLYSRVTREKLFSKTFSEAEYSIGLGALGDDVDDYYTVMGEMITIGGTMVWLPTDGNDTPDFLIPKADTGKIKVRTGFNVSLNGVFNELFYFVSDSPQGVSLGEIYSELFRLASIRRPDYKGAIGLAACARMPAVFGSGILKSPVREFAPANGRMITDGENLEQWMESDKESRHTGVTGLICGIGVSLQADLSALDQEILNRIFYLHPANTGGKSQMLHNHGVLFSPQPFPERAVNLEKQIGRVVEEGDFIDMRHLLDSSTIEKALIGVSYLQELRQDNI